MSKNRLGGGGAKNLRGCLPCVRVWQLACATRGSLMRRRLHLRVTSQGDRWLLGLDVERVLYSEICVKNGFSDVIDVHSGLALIFKLSWACSCLRHLHRSGCRRCVLSVHAGNLSIRGGLWCADGYV